ncbi:MAG: NADH dehydrogenase subunit, partial [Thermoplasmata archaeon]
TQIADIPIVIASIDPCLSCADRMTVVDERTGKSKVMTLQQMREMGWSKTREIRRRVK